MEFTKKAAGFPTFQFEAIALLHLHTNFMNEVQNSSQYMMHLVEKQNYTW